MKTAARLLWHSPGFTLTAVTTLAICVAANLAIFAFVDATLLRPLPFPHAEGLVTLVNAYPGNGVERSSASIANYFERRGAIPALSSIAIFREDTITVGERGAPNRIPIARVTPEFFATLGVPLALGTAFTDAQLTWSTDQVAVITQEFWQTHFQGDPSVVGKTFLNDGLPVTVVGVLPAGFRFLSSHAQFFRPASHDPRDRLPAARHNNSVLMVGRLAPGHSITEAQSELDALNATLLRTEPDAAFSKSAQFCTRIYDLHGDHVREVRPTLILLQCGAGLLLLIGTVNLVNLFLVRTLARAKDLAVRAALGASRRVLLQDVLAETVSIAAVGAIVGVALAAVAVRLLTLLGTDRLPLGSTVTFGANAVACAFALAVAIAVAIALPVFWFAQRPVFTLGLKGETLGATGSRSLQRLRHAFIVAQVALAFVLLMAAALLGVSLRRVLETPTGFQPSRVMTGLINLPWKSYPTPETRLAFIERALPAIRALPGVSHAAMAFNVPFTKGGADGAVVVIGDQRSERLPATHFLSAVSADYWATLGIPLVTGRLLEDADNHRAQHVCVVDEAFARHYWPQGQHGEGALGRQIALGFKVDSGPAFTIVGVVGSVTQKQLSETPSHGAVYFPYTAFQAVALTLVARTTGEPSAMAPVLRKAILSLDPELPLDDVRSMQSRIDDSLVARRSPAVLAALFCVVALLLAAVGTYGVLAYAVRQRQREIGVRMAIGALPSQIAGLFLTTAIRLIGAGLVLGLAGAWAAARAMQSMLFHVSSLPIGVAGASIAIMSLVALAATVLPAWRASRVDPTIALRSE